MTPMDFSSANILWGFGGRSALIRPSRLRALRAQRRGKWLARNALDLTPGKVPGRGA